MKRHLSIVCSVVFAALVAIPCQLLAASITEKSTAIGEGCIASGENSTAMGLFTFAAGKCSTTMGSLTMARGEYSLAGGFALALTEEADHTFVWGYSNNIMTIEKANAFLIFPLDNSGEVGIGTATPQEKVHIRRKSDTRGAAILLDSTGAIYGRKYYIGSTLSDNIGGSGLFQIYDVTAGRSRMVIDSSGDVGIGTTTPDYPLEVVGNAAKTSGGTTWINSSDVRLKDVTGEYRRGLDAIASLRPVSFFYKQDNPRGLPSNEENIGFIAQEVQEVFPEAVSEGPDGYLDFNMHPVNVALVNAVKELKAENEALREEIRQIKAAFGM